MKYTVNKFGLLGLCLLLSIFAIRSMVNAADSGVRMDPTYPARVWYRSVLHTLNLGSATENGNLVVADGKLQFSNGLIVGDNQTVSVGTNGRAVIGGGGNNTVSANYAAVGGGQSNVANANYAVVGGGNTNKANGQNAVVVGGDHNTAAAGSVVVGGQSNTAQAGGVVLGGKNNTSHLNSLALGQNATSNEGSFAWNSNAGEDSAYINASRGTLVGTTTPIAGVNLVVDGAVQVEGNTVDAGVKGEIRYVGGCFYGYDGSKWHVMNRGNDVNYNSECTAFSTDTAKFCYFGNTILWDGDTAIGYQNPYSTNCNSSTNRKTVTCTNGSISPSTHKHPYCYTIHAN